MIITTDKKELLEFLNQKRKLGSSIGFVATMGYLHAGHQSLIEQSAKENDITVVSDFVNPIQFNETLDFESYPKDIDRDIAIASESGADVIFIPGVNDIYPRFPEIDFKVIIENDKRALFIDLEAKSRPKHFDGVVTVVTKLLGLIYPDKAYFGEKDYQQLLIIKDLCNEFFPGINIVSCPTVRESDGLAMSSRNARLSKEQRLSALAIPKAIFAGIEAIKSGEKNPFVVEEIMIKELCKESALSIDYCVCRSPVDLEPIGRIVDQARVLIAARLDSVRLIDNLGWQKESK
jgi:pantoate--beta-alanine ligase